MVSADGDVPLWLAASSGQTRASSCPMAGGNRPAPASVRGCLLAVQVTVVLRFSVFTCRLNLSKDRPA
jgi:hypothetical protein